jgi:trigger factor
MNIEKIKTSGMRYDYRVVLSANEVDERIVEAVGKKAKTFKMHGFRPGRVPFNIVRKNVESSILPKVLEELASDACKSVVKEIGSAEIAVPPTYKFVSQYKSGQGIVLEVIVETAPEFELHEFKCVLNKVVPNIRDEDVLAQKKSIMDNFPVFKKTNKEYSIQCGDEISYTVKCYVNGTEDKKGGYSNALRLPVELPEEEVFLKRFIGLKVHEFFEHSSVKNPAEMLIITITSIRERLNDLTDEQYVSESGLVSLDEFDRMARLSVELGINRLAFIYHKQQILDVLSNEYAFDLPETVVRQETKNVVANIRRELEREKIDGTVDKADLTKTNDDFAAEYEPIIKKRVLLGYVLNKFARKYGITASFEEVETAIVTSAKLNNQDLRLVEEFYAKNPAAIAYKRAEIIEEKVITHLLSLAEGHELQKTEKEINELVEKILEDE